MNKLIKVFRITRKLLAGKFVKKHGGPLGQDLDNSVLEKLKFKGSGSVQEVLKRVSSN